MSLHTLLSCPSSDLARELNKNRREFRRKTNCAREDECPTRMTRSLISAGSAVSDTPRAQKDGSVPTPSHTRLTGAPRQAARTPRARPRLAAPEVAWHGPLKGHSARPSRDQCAGSGVPEAGASEVASPEAFVSSTSFPGYRLPSISCGRHRGCTARMPIRGLFRQPRPVPAAGYLHCGGRAPRVLAHLGHRQAQGKPATWSLPSSEQGPG